ncbi:hypothetical protein Mpsy_0907 [Methanolobus psychrophilus R15]|nr:hypothetical protein Mpsy_0907 [Methanolobus psychrophilus R15]
MYLTKILVGSISIYSTSLVSRLIFQSILCHSIAQNIHNQSSRWISAGLRRSLLQKNLHNSSTVIISLWPTSSFHTVT